jgi:hypothetical protein
MERLREFDSTVRLDSKVESGIGNRRLQRKGGTETTELISLTRRSKFSRASTPPRPQGIPDNLTIFYL